ncbi:hypothetical protein R1sor_012812 [Riccia sorocarpa]|uniref:Reverse transcriptase domain-containing protein n=1 Tax=Riccia sorocarpa TaxID=122646 RepID=A0ABD3I5G2_9MARC
MVSWYYSAAYTRRKKHVLLVVRGNRLEQSRIDRVYMSRSGEWLENVKKVDHIGGKTLSDHIPVVVQLQLRINNEEVQKKTTYFKFDYRILEEAEVFREARKVWLDHPKENLDPRVKWVLGWRRLKSLFRRVQKEKREEARNLEKREEELQSLRIEVEMNPSEYNLTKLVELEREVREQECQKARICREQSRNRWFKDGEAPTKYFFSQLKAKHRREEIKALKLDSGQVITSERGVMQEIGRFYADLYEQPEVSTGEELAREQVLSYGDTKVSSQQNEALAAVPEMEELEKIVKGLPEEKAPGLDGVTAEVLTRCWSFMKIDCLAMLVSFWEDGVLTLCDSKGVIKLLPKNAERQRLRNWRPITLLTLTYKLISKVLASRLKGVLPGLVDEHQTGFVDGRSIHDSILLHRFSQEYAQATHQETVLIKLDFEKAYDRVSHAYLRAVLLKMEFCPNFTELTMGLLKHGTAVVHTNGLFSREFQLGRGVRQGCLIAPFLFALCTESLMTMMRTYQEEGLLEGIKLPGGKQALYNLFADNTELSIKAEEVNYLRVKELLQVYEEASGAKLNVRKSVMLPVSISELPLWITSSGCRIAARGEIVLHLGFPGGDSISESQVSRYLYEKITNRTDTWSNRWLTWSSRIILAQKILPSLPAYILMTFGLSKKGYKLLEDAWRIFIWGTREDGAAKKSAIAWETMQKSKNLGGVKILSLESHSAAVKIRQITKIIEGCQGSWLDIARSFITRNLATGRQRTEMRLWTAEESLLIGPRLIIRESTTLKTLLQAWYKVRGNLVFEERGGQLPAHLTIKQCLIIATERSGVRLSNEVKLRKFLKAEKIESLSDLQMLQSEWVLRRVEVEDRETMMDVDLLLQWLRPITATTLPLPQCAGWKWRAGMGTLVRSGWSHDTKWWKGMLTKEADTFEKMNRKWSTALSSEAWNRVWMLTWRKPSTPREGFWWWRTLWQGFWNGERARKARVSTGECPRCPQEIETTEHVFWSCPHARRRWTQLLELAQGTEVELASDIGWLQFKLKATDLKRTNAAWWVVAAELYKVTWRERCDRVFRNSRSHRPLRTVLHEAARSASSWLSNVMPENQKILTVKTLDTLTEWESKLMRSSTGSELQRDVEGIVSESTRTDTSVALIRASDTFELATSNARDGRVRRTYVSHVDEEGPSSPVLPDCLLPGHE